jgi:hypothetical protein
MAALGGSLDPWAKACHAAAIQLVKSGVFGEQFVRVARGSAKKVGGQHSWVVVGHDCYAHDAIIVDPTLWSYDTTVKGIWIGTAAEGRHTPHGSGSIWSWGRPTSRGGKPIKLTPKTPLSEAAKDFLDLLGPLDRPGWQTLASAPVEGWPAGEIYAAMHHTAELRILVPVDRLGMLTDLNPQGLYLNGPNKTARHK